jgi:hypothetical protein
VGTVIAIDYEVEFKDGIRRRFSEFQLNLVIGNERSGRLMDHIGQSRLLEIADKDVHLTMIELTHIEKCRECLDLYSKVILQVAQRRAKKRAADKKA